MTDQLKLTGLLAAGIWKNCKDGEIDLTGFAKYLLENGVTVHPCKAGQPAYFIFFDDELGIWDIEEIKIKDVCSRGIFTSPYTDEKEDDPESWQLIKFGTEDMFFAREEAEKAIGEKTLTDGGNGQ